MESEKVKEIKKALQDHSIEKLKYRDGIKIKELDFADILTLINELESENEKLSKKLDMWEKIICKKNDCIAELRKENGELLKENEELEKQCIEWSELYFKKRNQITELKDRIAELEEYIKGNEQDAKAFVNGWRKDLETELKQFAERLKEKKRLIHIGLEQKEMWFIKLTEEEIDETLEEFL